LRIWSALCAWPTFASAVSMFFVPTKLPRNTAATTNASQPKPAVFQWLALQRPMRAAMLFERFRGDIWTQLLRLGVSPRSQGDVGAEMRLPGLFPGGEPHQERGKERLVGGAEVRENREHAAVIL